LQGFYLLYRRIYLRAPNLFSTLRFLTRLPIESAIQQNTSALTQFFLISPPYLSGRTQPFFLTTPTNMIVARLTSKRATLHAAKTLGTGTEPPNFNAPLYCPKGLLFSRFFLR